MENKKEIIYVADIDQDVDDIIAVEYLHNKGVLKAIVLDPIPETEEGIKRLDIIKTMGITIEDDIPKDSKYVFVGGALKKVAQYIKNSKIDLLVMNGGFVGNNIKTDFTLPKFRNKKTVRTFNFNCNIYATDQVLKSKNIYNILLIGKNVCHNRRNTLYGIWKEKEPSLLKKYNVWEYKLMHDLLACYEGLVYLNMINDTSVLKYEILKPFNEGLEGIYTKWGSLYPDSESVYRECKVAVGWNKMGKKWIYWNDLSDEEKEKAKKSYAFFRSLETQKFEEEIDTSRVVECRFIRKKNGDIFVDWLYN